MKKLTRSKLIKKLDNVFSQYIRRKDAIDGIAKCISCGVERSWKELQCGHFMSRSHYSTRWEILNVGVQCISCNIFKHGQQYLFSKYLDKTYGEGTSNEIPRYTWLDINNNYRVSDLYIESGNYLRLKNIQIGYTLPKSVLSRMNALTWRFFVSAENLVTFTSYTGADPEIGAMGSFDIGIDRGVYPQARTFRFGTTISF